MAEKTISAIVAGTGFEGRAPRIRRFCKVGAEISLRREPNNLHDSDAIAVWMRCSVLWGLWRPWAQIGYIKAARADGMAKKMDAGRLVVRDARVHSFDVYPTLDHPRVSLRIRVEES
jgi:hypothetical protein